jgi:hypothetical protein
MLNRARERTQDSRRAEKDIGKIQLRAGILPAVKFCYSDDNLYQQRCFCVTRRGKMGRFLIIREDRKNRECFDALLDDTGVFVSSDG